MAFNLFEIFFEFVNYSNIMSTAVAFILGFIIWELPRGTKILPEEYTKGVYPENGRVADYVLFITGIIALAYMLLDERTAKIVQLLKTPGITSHYIVILIVVPLIILFGYLKRTFQRLDRHESIGLFITHSGLDLIHTLFFIAFSILTLPLAGYLIFGGK